VYESEPAAAASGDTPSLWCGALGVRAIAFRVPSITDILLWGGLCFSVAAACWWSVAIAKMWLTSRVLGVCDAGLSLPFSSRRVAVFVPAHNEQAVIGSLIDSLRAQDHPNCRFILALDRCTDETRAVALQRVAADARFVIHEINACPDGWAGKVHALHRAVEAHAGDAELLVFADADTILHPGCIRATDALAAARSLDLLSLLSTLTYDQPFERRAQAPCVFELVRRYPPLRASRDTDRRPFANGQFMLWTRSAYNRVGGHDAFRAELLEDIAMARAAWRERLRVHVIPAGAMLSCRMYPDEQAFHRGWQRIFIESANRKPKRLDNWAATAIARGNVVPGLLAVLVLHAVVSLLIGAQSWAWIALTAAVIALSLWLMGVWIFLANASVPRQHRVAVLLQWPMGSVATARILRAAAAALRGRRSTMWAGMSYDRPAR
jgi:chlorobactene glucosyltransferase